MVSLSSLLILCLVSVALARPSVDFVAGRSAGIIVQPSESVPQDSVILFKGDQFSTTQLNTLDDTQFFDLFAHVMGLPSPNVDAARQGFPTTSLFTKPKASVLIVIDSVGAETLNNFPSLSLLQDSHPTAIATETFPPTTHSVLASVATGRSPSAHGIVGASWRRASHDLVRAYDTNGHAFSASIADILLQEHRGRALVVSASASPSLASALAAHPELVSENFGWNAHAYAYAYDGEEFVSRYDEPSCDQVFAFSASLEDITTEKFTFTVGEHAEFLAELAFVNNLIEKLKSNDLVKDEIPDMYSFVFSSLKGIATKYGKDSDAFAAALKLVDQTSTNLIAALNALYDNRVAAAVIALNPRAFPTDASSLVIKEKVYNKVARLLASPEDFEAHFPALYVNMDDLEEYARDLACSNLQEAVESTIVHCFAPGFYARSDFELEVSYTTTNTTDEDTVWAFWLNFWVTVIIAAFILWGAYCLAYVGIDASKDSLLYRATGRHVHQN